MHGEGSVECICEALNTGVKSIGSGAMLLGFESRSHHLLAELPGQTSSPLCTQFPHLQNSDNITMQFINLILG